MTHEAYNGLSQTLATKEQLEWSAWEFRLDARSFCACCLQRLFNLYQSGIHPPGFQVSLELRYRKTGTSKSPISRCTLAGVPRDGPAAIRALVPPQFVT